MSQKKQALLLIGSPRGFKSNSKLLGGYLLGKLGSGYEAEELHIQAAMRSETARAQMLEKVSASDLLILALPLYIDSLPASVIAALELIAKQRKDDSSKNQRMVAIVNSGFPEASQNNTALAICRRFAAEADIEWAGGLGLGGAEL
jgi:hypothetical protein